MINTYSELDPDIILINSHGVPQEGSLKIHGYKVHKKNHTNTHTDGTAIAIKYNIKHKIYDDFISDAIAAEIETSTGKIIIATLYQPPTRQYIPIPDFTRIFRRNIPVYMLADLNANHPLLGYRTTNTKGRQIEYLIQNRTIRHIGPQFPTYIARNITSTPDIILSNNQTYHNMHITQGPLTTSDHIPIIFELSVNPILIPSPLRPKFKQANWDSFKEEIKENSETPQYQKTQH